MSVVNCYTERIARSLLQDQVGWVTILSSLTIRRCPDSSSFGPSPSHGYVSSVNVAVRLVSGMTPAATLGVKVYRMVTLVKNSGVAAITRFLAVTSRITSPVCKPC